MSKDRLESVARVAELLDYFLAQPGDAGVSEISRSLGYSKSVIHRMLTTLEAHGYVSATETRRYQLGFKALQLGVVALSRLDIRNLALPYMERLRAMTAETVNLSVRVETRRVYIESLESPQEIRQRVELGREMPLYLGASSKAILAFLPEKEREHILRTADGMVTASGVPLSADKMRDELRMIRQRGYAFTQSERLLGAFSIAAPVFDHRGDVKGSISISGPVMRWNPAMIEQFVPSLLEATRSLSRELGYHPEAIRQQPE